VILGTLFAVYQWRKTDFSATYFQTFRVRANRPPDCENGGTALGRFALILVKGSTLLLAKDSGMPHVENDRIVESTNEARAAVTGQNVNYILLISTLAAIGTLLAVAYFAMSS
jgi:hypothetical protein